ncbi:MAG: arylamine N-acetyltransferase [Dehalococcoidia bacterium]
MDLDAYLRRIGYAGSCEPTIETLRAMHRTHFYSVPFENLDISLGRRIEVDEDVNFNKIVNEGRGGFCLELTGTFARALRQMGFRVDVLGARVLAPTGQLSHPLSHMTLLVHLDEPWIVDVGFGGRIAAPLRLNDSSLQEAEGRSHAVANDGDHWLVTAGEPGNEGGTYVFTLQPREFGEFHEVCDWLQTSAESRFTHGPIVSLATPSGRRTLAGSRLILTENGARTESEVATEAEQREILREQFGIGV